MAITKKNKNILIGLGISVFIGLIIFIYYEFFNKVKGSSLTEGEIQNALMNNQRKGMESEMEYFTANPTFDDMKTNAPEWFSSWFLSEYVKNQLANPKYTFVSIDDPIENSGKTPYEEIGASLVKGIIAWQKSTLTWEDAVKTRVAYPVLYKRFINNLAGVKDPLKVLAYMNEKYNLPL